MREKILASDIVVLATPTWLGHASSVARRALERMDAMLPEQNEAGQMIAYNRVAGFVVTGNEDGAKSCISEMATGMVEIGFCVPRSPGPTGTWAPTTRTPTTARSGRAPAPTTSSTSQAPCASARSRPNKGPHKGP